LATIFAVALPLTAGFILFILAKARPLFFEIQERVDDVNAIIRENLAGIGVVNPLIGKNTKKRASKTK